ncbi:MAG: polyribonucleotide nucleotidyltransferase, partial [Planctomycetota bacterium]
METGALGKQAAGCVLVQYGETVTLSAVATSNPRPGIDFFPLTCDYRERFAAAGKFPGGFLKREGRPTTKETLTARLIDRPIRPMFAEGFKDEVQIQNFVMASDRQTDGDILAMNGASAALSVSPLPFLGPLGSVRLGKVDGMLVAFPTQEELEYSVLDLIVSGTKDAILMIEGFAREMPEDEMIEALLEAHRLVGELCDLQNELVDKVKPEKMAWKTPEPDGMADKLAAYHGELKAAKQTEGKAARAEAVKAVKDKALAAILPAAGDPASDDAAMVDSFKHEFHELEGKVVREAILEGKRPDGRSGKDLRGLYSEVDLLPQVHGSAMFQRGETQAMITVTLGTGRDEQRVDGLFEEYSKRFMLDYNFPSFSVGECRPIRGPGRREIGHGMLAERSVGPVLPNHDEFPYTIRVISDILESNGSSSMASVCGATLGLMAAGVPITNPVAGISVGLVKEGDDFTLLTDILG